MTRKEFAARLAELPGQSPAERYSLLAALTSEAGASADQWVKDFARRLAECVPLHESADQAYEGITAGVPYRLLKAFGQHGVVEIALFEAGQDLWIRRGPGGLSVQQHALENDRVTVRLWQAQSVEALKRESPEAYRLLERWAAGQASHIRIGGDFADLAAVGADHLLDINDIYAIFASAADADVVTSMFHFLDGLDEAVAERRLPASRRWALRLWTALLLFHWHPPTPRESAAVPSPRVDTCCAPFILAAKALGESSLTGQVAASLRELYRQALLEAIRLACEATASRSERRRRLESRIARQTRRLVDGAQHAELQARRRSIEATADALVRAEPNLVERLRELGVTDAQASAIQELLPDPDWHVRQTRDEQLLKGLELRGAVRALLTSEQLAAWDAATIRPEGAPWLSHDALDRFLLEQAAVGESDWPASLKETVDKWLEQMREAYQRLSIDAVLAELGNLEPSARAAALANQDIRWRAETLTEVQRHELEGRTGIIEIQLSPFHWATSDRDSLLQLDLTPQQAQRTRELLQEGERRNRKLDRDVSLAFLHAHERRILQRSLEMELRGRFRQMLTSRQKQSWDEFAAEALKKKQEELQRLHAESLARSKQPPPRPSPPSTNYPGYWDVHSGLWSFDLYALAAEEAVEGESDRRPVFDALEQWRKKVQAVITLAEVGELEPAKALDEMTAIHSRLFPTVKASATPEAYERWTAQNHMISQQTLAFLGHFSGDDKRLVRRLSALDLTPDEQARCHAALDAMCRELDDFSEQTAPDPKGQFGPTLRARRALGDILGRRRAEQLWAALG